jgi:hypothetical protein
MFALSARAASLMSPTRMLALGGIAILVLAGCGGGGNDPPPAGVPKKIVMVTQPPGSVAARATIAPSVVVQVLDGRDDPVLQSGIPIQAGISSGGPTLVGTLIMNTDAQGQATFSNLQVNGAVGPRVLQFTSSGLKAALSSTVTVTPGPASGLGPNSVTTQNTLVNSPVPVKPSVKVTDLDGNGVQGVGVTFAVTGGGGSGTGLNQNTDANGVATVGGWTSGPNLSANTMTATSGSLTGSPVTFTANGVTTISNFNIDLEFITSVTPSQSAAFSAAKAKWEQAITGDEEDLNVGTVDLSSCGPNTTVSGFIDDLKIVVELKPHDGVGNILGAASPCFIRNNGPSVDIPIIGYMFFDTADLANIEANGALSDVVLHEMGHVLGYGTLWEGFGLNLINNNGPTGVGYTGSNGLSAFLTINNGNGTVVPVEQDGGAGTARSHWDEGLFASEIMTGFISGTVRPLSATSIASLADFGYVVNLNAADAFNFNFPNTLRGGPVPAPLRLGNDVIPATIMYLDTRTGRTWAVPRR